MFSSKLALCLLLAIGAEALRHGSVRMALVPQSHQQSLVSSTHKVRRTFQVAGVMLSAAALKPLAASASAASASAGSAGSGSAGSVASVASVGSVDFQAVRDEIGKLYTADPNKGPTLVRLACEDGIYLQVTDVATLEEGAIMGVLIPLEAFNLAQQITDYPAISLDEVYDGNDFQWMREHPVTLEEFYVKYSSFAWGPVVMAGLLYAATLVPMVALYISANDMQLLGWKEALQYTVYQIMACYACHGWMSTHAPQSLKLQSGKDYNISPASMAVRSAAALSTSMVYTFLPLAPDSTSWLQFVAWAAGLALAWDFHFYWAHRWTHTSTWAYKSFHKLHHMSKEPNCFGAYFVTYQSHVLLEQLVVIAACYAGIPKNVFLFVMYWGTFGSYLEHCGFELGSVRLPFIPATFGNLCSAIGFSTAIFDGVSVAEHDWHHEKFTTNYSLSFKYLDKIFGTYHAGRVPGEQVRDAKDTKDDNAPATAPTATAATSTVRTAQYKQLKHATVEDFEVQGRAFDAYAEAGCIVDNVLGLLVNMK
ncbi:hypothetical protein B484DRAFT_400700, partial [Ochromonadaceae sp. CCMP2298]